MAKTKTRTTGRVSNRFWQLLGASTDKDQARSMAQVRDSAEFDEKAADLDDEQLRKAAGLLNLDDLADSADIPQFLAVDVSKLAIHQSIHMDELVLPAGVKGVYDTNEPVVTVLPPIALEEKPADKLVSGLATRTMVAAQKKTGSLNGDAYRAEVGKALSAELKAFPYPVVESHFDVIERHFYHYFSSHGTNAFYVFMKSRLLRGLWRLALPWLVRRDTRLLRDAKYQQYAEDGLWFMRRKP